MEKLMYVYIMTNQKNGVLYIGVTNNISRRPWEHKNDSLKGFTQKYKCKKLVYVEHFESILDALEREKNIKNRKRQWKLNLINQNNPLWEDLGKEL